MLYLLILFFGALICFLFTRLSRKYFPLLGLVDRPKKYRLKRSPIPYYGGLGIFFSFLVTVLTFLGVDQTVLVVLGGAFLIVLVSFLDDYLGLSPYIRLLVQVLIGFLVFLFGIGIESVRIPFVGEFGLDIWTYSGMSVLALIATVGWFVLLMNVMNFLDGLNGLVSGTSTISFLVIFLLSIQSFHLIDQFYVSVMSIALVGICLVFWFFDFYPAKILMGDTGSMFLGYMIAILSILAGGKLATAILVLGFPILDAFWVILRRIYDRKSPFKGDYKHLHHRLLRMGLTEKRALTLNYVFCGLFGLVALLSPSTLHKGIAILSLILVMFFVALYVVKKEN